MKRKIVGAITLFCSLLCLASCCFPEHEWEEFVIKEATCTESGLKTKRCKKCSLSPDYFQQTIPALGHKEKVLPGETASCTHQGLSEGSVCERCGITLIEQQIIPMTEHTPIAVGTFLPATCEEDGLSAKIVCSECGLTLEEAHAIPATGHHFEYVSTIQPTCTSVGYAVYECEHCHATERRDEVAPLGHLPVIDEAKQQDCIHDGMTEGSHCARCGEVIVAQSVVPHDDNHSPKTIEYIAPTCTEKGYRSQVICDVCGLILEKFGFANE